ncbi:tyrosine-type recombinase/integrase [Mesorhizobium sp.]|uniref:tyrosine-type recombinase/integrase n=1 Tax=Mesorhizobium sp. TaxID=1871066 RepID=UPI000FE42BD2|nr:tyrosine-type recombinase/integrase [Mesorhizobium sp.]RWQ21571.1 MAG: site-specific integrase [Mesorhizobium sp.]
MAKTLTEAPLSTRNARAGLAEGMHWRGLNPDVHLGYRKQKRGGRWLVRWYQGDQKYKQETLGTADDGKLEADGVECLTFEQAKTAAARHVSTKRADDLASVDGPAPTVLLAVDAYLIAQEARELARDGKAGSRGDARLRLTRHVLSAPVADKPLHSLTERDLSKWREGLPNALAATTVRRIVNDFKAALNAAAVKHRARLPADVAIIIKNGLATSHAETPTARDKSALPDSDIRRAIVAAARVDERDGWDGDLLRLVVVLSATGARFSQVKRLAVGDVQQNRLMVPTSRKGRGTKKASHSAIRVGADVMKALRPAIAGRRPSDVLLERWRHKQDKGQGHDGTQWVRNARGPWLTASELSRPWAEIVKLAELPADTVPYALRHSSIVRQLRNSLPVRLVAALHDTSARMIEAHYSAAIIDALDDLSAGAVVPLMPIDGDNVAQLRAG